MAATWRSWWLAEFDWQPGWEFTLGPLPESATFATLCDRGLRVTVVPRAGIDTASQYAFAALSVGATRITHKEPVTARRERRRQRVSSDG